MSRKVKSFKQCVYRNSVRCQKLQQVFEVQSFDLDTGTQSFCYSFIATVVIETTQLVMSQFKNFLSDQLRIE